MDTSNSGLITARAFVSFPLHIGLRRVDLQAAGSCALFALLDHASAYNGISSNEVCSDTFGLEWSENYLYTWVDSRLQQVLFVDFKKKDFWQRGHFQGQYENGTLLTNPWYISGNKNAPFDQKFYLILNVAVGSRNGWFLYVLAVRLAA
jgi:hypothetical protein